MVETPAPETPPVTIKKYANRRLYNTATSSYVTLDHLAKMVKEGTEFVVFDAKSGEDITRSVLTQIIVEEEAKGHHLLPISFLRHLISFYGDSLQALLPGYLEHSMHSFAHNQERMRRYMTETLDGLFPFNQFEEMGRQNVALLENTMKMFSPFYPDKADARGNPASPEKARSNAAANGKDVQAEQKIEDLRDKLNEMQRQLDSLTGSQKKE